MENPKCHDSEQLIAYMLGELHDEERVRMEDHIGSCSTCRQELRELQEAWHAIPHAMDEIAVPTDLKAQVMDHIFPTEKLVIKKRWPRHTGWVASAVLLLMLLGMFWNNLQLREQLQALNSEPTLPTKVVETYSLNTANPVATAASGIAWLMQQGDTKKLVFNVQGLNPTKGQEAYQVWLIHQGTRKSAGVFLVDEQGNGVLTFDMQEQSVPFEAIGITLEPDSFGDQPRGKKVLGT